MALGLTVTIWVLALAPRGLFSGDSGVKLAQTYALWTTGFSTRALPAHPDVDPAGEFMAYGEFKRQVDGQWQGIYSVTFTALAAPLLGAFGMTGVLILPLIGTLLVLAGTFALARRVGCEPWWAFAVSALVTLATPILLYSSQLTEHTLATGLVTWALVQVIRDRTSASRHDLIAGLLVGFAATVRPECYLAIGAVGTAVLVPPRPSWPIVLRRGALYAAGALVVLVPYWLVNLRLSGTWDPLVTFQEGGAASWSHAGVFLVGATRDPVTLILVAYALCLVTGALPAAWLRGAGVQLATTLLLVVVVVLSILVVREGADSMTGLFNVTPLAIVGVWAGGRSPAARRAWISTVVFLVAVLVLNRSYDAGGLQLGSRLLMPALPALLCLAGVHVQDRASDRPRRGVRELHRVAIAGLFVLSLVAMVRGIRESTAVVRNGARAVEIARRSEARVVVSTVWWQSQVLAPVLLDGKVLLFAKDTPTLRRLGKQLTERGVTEIVVLEQVAPSAAAAADLPTLDWGREGMMQFRSIRLARPRP